jgi:hypothetical protein
MAETVPDEGFTAESLWQLFSKLCGERKQYPLGVCLADSCPETFAYASRPLASLGRELGGHLRTHREK